MSALGVLRKLAEFQQHHELIEAGESLWNTGREPAVGPLLALAHAHLGEKERAEELLDGALARGSELDVDARIDAAAALMRLQRVDEAVPLLEQALAEAPVHALGLARLGLCRMLHGDLDAATPLFEQAAELEPERIAVHAILAQLHLQRAQYELAQPVLERGLQSLAERRDELPELGYRQFHNQFQAMQFVLWVLLEDFAQAEEQLQELALEQHAGSLEEDDFVHYASQYSRLLAERDLHEQAADILREYLRQYPNNITLCVQLAQIAQVQGRFTQAVALLRKALKQDENDIGLWVQLSSACLHRFDKRARSAAERAVALVEASEGDDVPARAPRKLHWAQAQNALAQVETHERKFDDAERRFREVLAKHPRFVPSIQGLGQMCMQRGRIEEAVELFERVKRIDPLRGNSALINARRFPEDVATLERMERAARIPSLEGPVKATILFQLAAAWDKRKDYGKAFELAKQANTAGGKFLPYDPKAHRNRCARIREAFCAQLYEHRRGCGVASSLPVYVLVMPRSGTTLVEQILSGHSEIFGAGELGVIGQVAVGLNRWERHVGSGRSYPECVDDLTPRAVEGIANQVLEELREYAPDAKHVVDKLPHNFENIGLIKFLLPNAKIISVRRDPRDIAISNYFTDYQSKHSGMGFAYDLTHVGEQLADHNLLMHHWHKLFPGEILELAYEDVVDDLEGSARRMLEYIGVSWEPDVLNFNELERTVKTASVWQVRQPIYHSSKARWKNYERELQPLIQGTNARISPDAYEMQRLPEPGFLTRGVDLFRQGDLDAAELSFKKMLHHNPDHAACNYMVGMVYLHKGHADDGIELIEKAIRKTPSQRAWRKSLVKAYESVGRHDDAARVKRRRASRAAARG